MKYLIAIFTIAVLFSSCTIEKRHFLPGYHVEWKSAKTRVKKNHKPIEDLVQNEKEGPKSDHDKDSIPKSTAHTFLESYPQKIKTDTLAENNQLSKGNQLIAQLKGDQLEFNWRKQSKIFSRDPFTPVRKERVVSGRNKLNILALFSFISVLLIFLVVPAFSAFILGAFSKRQFVRGSGGSKGRWMAEVGYTIGMVGLIALGLLFLLIGLYGGDVVYIAIALAMMPILIFGIIVANNK